MMFAQKFENGSETLQTLFPGSFTEEEKFPLLFIHDGLKSLVNMKI